MFQEDSRRTPNVTLCAFYKACHFFLSNAFNFISIVPNHNNSRLKVLHRKTPPIRRRHPPQQVLSNSWKENLPFNRKKPPAGPLEERLILIIFRTIDHPLKVLTKSFVTGGSVSSAETFSDVCSSSLKRRIFSTHISSRGFVFSPATTVIKNTFSRICLVKWQLHWLSACSPPCGTNLHVMKYFYILSPMRLCVPEKIKYITEDSIVMWNIVLCHDFGVTEDKSTEALLYLRTTFFLLANIKDRHVDAESASCS